MSGPLLTVAGTGGSVAGAEERDAALSVALPGIAPAPRVLVRAGAYLTVPSLLILGTDAVLAAQPATPVQLAHACQAAGFDVVVPATWGDEIIARATAERARRSERPLLQCSCPFVARRLAGHTDVLGHMLVRLIPPPVAAARYLRRVYGDAEVRITYAGGCPLPATEAIDAQLSSIALLDRLSEHGVSLSTQPREYDSVLPPDRRRHFSIPGGVPCEDTTRPLLGDCDVVELSSGDVEIELAQHLIAGEHAILDVATAFGCHCSGVVDGIGAAQARGRVRELEPPRSSTPILEHELEIELEDVVWADIPAQTEMDAADAVAAPHMEAVSDSKVEPAVVVVDAPPRRRSPQGLSRAVLGAMPLTRAERGRQLPRAYVARRRSSPRGGMRQSGLRHEAPSAAPLFKLRRHWMWIWIGALALMLGIAIATAVVVSR